MGVVRLSRLADADLDCIRAYIERDNPSAASNLLDKLFGTVETLADHPEIGERREDLMGQQALSALVRSAC
jgi:plasmid stabilization system protein ParE